MLFLTFSPFGLLFSLRFTVVFRVSSGHCFGLICGLFWGYFVDCFGIIWTAVSEGFQGQFAADRDVFDG